jgi:hypothetical protein
MINILDAVSSNGETLLFQIETAILIKNVPCRDTHAHFTHLPAITEFCSTTSSPILSFHFRTLTAQTTSINNIRFVTQG